MKKCFLSVFLITFLLFSVIGQGIIAFAESETEPVVVTADGEKIDKLLQGLSIEDLEALYGLTGLMMNSTNGGEANVTVNGGIDVFVAAGDNGSVFGPSAGVFEYASGEDSQGIFSGFGDVNVQTMGEMGSSGFFFHGSENANVEMNLSGDIASSSEIGASQALTGMLSSGSTGSFFVDGEIAADSVEGEAFGIVTTIMGGASGDLTVTGNVSASAVTGDATGVSASSTSKGSESLTTIDGNITATTGNGNATGISVLDWSGSSSVSVGGTVGAESKDGNAAGISLNSIGDTTVEVSGDVNAQASGIDKDGNNSSETGDSIADKGAAVGVNSSVSPMGSGVFSGTVTIEGGVTASGEYSATGVQATAMGPMNGNGEVVNSIQVQNDVIVLAGSKSDEDLPGSYGVGLKASSMINGEIQIDIGGDIAVDGGSGTATGVESQITYGGTNTITFGDVTVTTDKGSATGIIAIDKNPVGYSDSNLEMPDSVKAMAEAKAKTSINVDGDITASAGLGSAQGFIVSNTTGGTSDITVNGNVFVLGDGENSVAVRVGSAKGSKTTAYIEGNIESTGVGISTNASKGSETDVEVKGNVTTASDNSYGRGVESSTDWDGAKMTITIGGDVAFTINGFEAVPDDPTSGGNAFYVQDKGGQTDISVGGSIISEANGIFINTDPNADVNFSVGENITAEGNALFLNNRMPKQGGSSIDVLVEGTISGVENAILVNGLTADDVTITVWKIEVPEGTPAVSDFKPTYANEEVVKEARKDADEIEDNILYIVKVEQPKEGATVSLKGTTGSHGFDTAKEGETVTLKTSVEAGYKIVGAYQGEDDNKAILLQDDNGDYYIVVPKGGGVYLTIDAERIFNIENFGSPVLPGMTTGVQNNQASPVYLPGAGASDGAVVLSSSPSQNYGLAQVTLYRNGSYVIYKTDGSAESGTYAYGDGQLKFDGKLVEHWIDAEGNIHCVYVNARGERIEFVIDKATASSLAA